MEGVNHWTNLIMEKFQFIIKSDLDAFDIKKSESEIHINGISVPLDEIVELTVSSQGFSGRGIEGDASIVRIATKTKQVTITQGKAIFFGIGKKKDRGASLFHAISEPIIEAVAPRLVFNAVKSLAEGNSILVGPFRITREGLFTKKMFSDKFCSWDWNIRADIARKSFDHFFSATTEQSFGFKISFTSPETNDLEEFGFLKSNEVNSGILSSLCMLLGKRDDEYMYKMFQPGKEAESGGLRHLKSNIGRLKNMPESALKRRLGKRFPEIL